MLRSDDGGTASVSTEEPFRVQLSSWPLESGAVELHVLVGQKGQRVAFSTVLPGAALEGVTLTRQESVAPLMEAEAFARLWPPLVALAQAHGHAPLPALGLAAVEAMEELVPPRALMGMPTPTRLCEFELEASSLRLTLRRKRQLRPELAATVLMRTAFWAFCWAALYVFMMEPLWVVLGAPVGTFLLLNHMWRGSSYLFDILTAAEVSIEGNQMTVRRNVAGFQTLTLPYFRAHSS